MHRSKRHLYSITSSARPRSVGGIVRPRAFAVEDKIEFGRLFDRDVARLCPAQIIAANLTTAGKARTVLRDLSTNGAKTGMAKCPTDVSDWSAAYRRQTNKNPGRLARGFEFVRWRDRSDWAFTAYKKR